MSEEQVTRAEDDYEMLKETVQQQYMEIQRLNTIINNIANYIDRMSYASIVDNPKKELSRILEKGE